MSESPKLRRSSRKVAPVCYHSSVMRIVGEENVWPQRRKSVSKAGGVRRTGKKVQRKTPKSSERNQKRIDEIYRARDVPVEPELPDLEILENPIRGNPQYQHEPIEPINENEPEQPCQENQCEALVPQQRYPMTHAEHLRSHGKPWIQVITIKEESGSSGSRLQIASRSSNREPSRSEEEDPANRIFNMVVKQESIRTNQQQPTTPPTHVLAPSIKAEPGIEQFVHRRAEYLGWTTFQLGVWLAKKMSYEEHKELFDWIEKTGFKGTDLSGILNRSCPMRVPWKTFHSFQTCVLELIR